MFIRTPYNYDRDAVSIETGLACEEGSSLTQQQFRDECDINTIITRFGLASQVPDGLRMPQYGDFTNISSYHEAMNSIAVAGETFDQLPAAIRDRFYNDPGKFVDFTLDPANADELVSLGLASKKAPPPVVPVSVPPSIVVPPSAVD